MTHARTLFIAALLTSSTFATASFADVTLEEFQKLNSIRDRNDLVAQVLNYSTYGNENGSSYGFWIKDEQSKCLYRRITKSISSMGGGQFDLSMALLSGDPRALALVDESNIKTIDLDNIDPRNLEFTSSPQISTVNYENKKIISAPGQVSLERLQRGWSLIYSKYCTGKRKAF